MARKSTRLLFHLDNTFYKFASFFVDKNDNSFYFHLYEEANENYKSYKVTSENGNTKIEFDKFVEHDFKRNKLSVHESGYLHSTDKTGKRLKDNVIGIPFSQIETSKLILILAPKKIDRLLKIGEPDTSRDIVIFLATDITPFVVNFEVVKKTAIDLPVEEYEDNILKGVIEITIDDKDYGLRLYLQTVNGKGDWPDFSFTLTRIG